MVAFVISARGVFCRCEYSGLVVALGVGNGGGSSSAMDARPFLIGAALLRFRGDGFFVGDIGSGATLSSGSNICVGSRTSVFRFRRPRPFAFGVAGSSVVLRRVVRLGLLCGAGVKSSASSSWTGASTMISSSGSSTTIFLRAAALLEGREGDIEAIVGKEVRLCTVSRRKNVQCLQRCDCLHLAL